MVQSNLRNIVLALTAFLAFGIAQDNKPPEKKPPSQAEYDLIQSIDKDADANHRLQTLDKWAKDFPASDYADVRRKAYLITYQQLNRTRDAVNMAQEMLKADPNDVLALTLVVSSIYTFNPPPPAAADLDTAEKAAKYLLNNTDAVYAPDRKPAEKTAEQWAQLKPQMKVYAQQTVGWINMTRKDNERAEQELAKALEMDPTQAQVSQWLAGVILAQNKTKPEKQPLALYHYARAAAYDGPGSLPAANRTTIQTYLGKIYKTYHGSDEGLDKLLAMAKANPVPPPDFKIESTADIAMAKAKAEAEAAAANPMMTLWKTIKGELTSDHAQAYFETSVKGAALPGGANGVHKFKGKLISMAPAVKPKVLILAVEKADVPDVTLKLGTPLPGKMDPGAEISFDGTATEFTKEPYMLTFEVMEKSQIQGWTGQNVPTPAKKSGATAKKKASK